jgi:hypothetical protein
MSRLTLYQADLDKAETDRRKLPHRLHGQV